MPHPLSVGARESSESQKPQRKAWARASATPADSLSWTLPILRYQAFLNLKGSPCHCHLASGVKAILNPRRGERIDPLIPHRRKVSRKADLKRIFEDRQLLPASPLYFDTTPEGPY